MKVRSSLLLRFDAFYGAYPKKKHPADAEKAWVKLKPDADMLAAMLAALDWQKCSRAWTKDGGAFIPHPATYLNAGAWRDEPEPDARSPATGGVPIVTQPFRSRFPKSDAALAKPSLALAKPSPALAEGAAQ